MLFTEFVFIFVFLPIVFLAYELAQAERVKLFVLTLSSCVFYAAWRFDFLILFMGSISVNYLFSRLLFQYRRKSILLLGILCALTPLSYFKYSVFIFGIFDAKLPVSIAPTLLPLGISFYTFQQLTYLVDVYSGKVPRRYSLLEYSFYVSFFPQLVAGPIVHHHEILPQINHHEERNLYEAFTFFLCGFVKKIFIADALALIVDPVFSTSKALSFFEAWSGALGYTFQLYFDFSGYSDMALGLGLLFGFRLPINFNSPYKAWSITDFWRRWHITLSHFLRDYLYIPLGGNRVGISRKLLNIMIVMLLGGLWHGAGWTFVAWGGLHGLMLAMEAVIVKRYPHALRGSFAKCRTFLLVSLLWVLFRAENWDTAVHVYSGIFSSPHGLPKLDGHFLFLLCCGALCFWAPSSHSIARWVKERFAFDQDVGKLAKQMCWAVGGGQLLIIASLYLFYTTNVDKMLYSELPIERTQQLIENKVGDFRSNFLSSQLVSAKRVKKVAVVGASFTKGMGNFQFEFDGVPYMATSLGIGGNSIINGLRTATALLDVEDNAMDTIIVGVSPLNFKTPLPVYCSFGGQGMEGVARLGFDLPQKKFSSLLPVDLSPLDLLQLTLDRDSRYQFNNFVARMATVLQFEPVHSPSKLDMTEKGFNDFRESEKLLLADAQKQEVPIRNLENGSDARFKWESRTVMESLESEGDVYRAFAALKAACDRKKVSLVLYDTPTPRHAFAPHVYPSNFIERYEDKMLSLTNSLGIRYVNLIDYLPWSGAAFMDFIHPQREFRKLILKRLLFEVFCKSNHEEKSH